jgi:hypothetical protein
MKTTKSPMRINKSLALIIPDAIVKFFGITAKSRLTIKTNKEGFKVKVRP